MRIGFTAHTGGGAEANVITEVIVHMGDAIENALSAKLYGGKLNDVVFVPIAVYSDLELNGKFVEKSNRVQRGKDFQGNWYNSICFGLSFDPEVVSKMSFEDFRQVLSDAMIKRLKDPQLKIPKVFDYESFKQDMIQVVDVYRLASFG